MSEHENPYLGPKPFDKQNHRSFYGRAFEIGELLSLTLRKEVVVFYALSGAGKTSLINAGLIRALEDKGHRVIGPVRVAGSSPSVDCNPFLYNLVSQVHDHESKAKRWNMEMGADELARIGLGELFDWYISGRTVLIIDQFEEIFFRHTGDWDQRNEFFLQLRQALLAAPELTVVLSIRFDYVAYLERFAPIVPGGLQSRFGMELLSFDGAVLAVEQPVETIRPFDSGVAEYLVRKIQTQGLPQGLRDEFVEPVTLQVVCHELWDKLPKGNRIQKKHIDAHGQVEEALQSFYDKIVRDCCQTFKDEITEEEVRRWIETRVIVDGRREHVTLGEPSDLDLPPHVIKWLVKRHLLRSEEVRNTRWVELIHDRFVQPILSSNSIALAGDRTLLADARAWLPDPGEAELGRLRRWRYRHGLTRRRSYLYSGRKLRKAERLFLSIPPSARPEYQAMSSFLKVSRSAETARRIVFGVSLLLLFGAALLWNLHLQRTNGARMAALAHLMTTNLVHEIDPQHSLPFAVKAAETHPDVIAGGESVSPFLKATLARSVHYPRTRRGTRALVTVEINEDINHLRMTPDGERLAAISKENNLWVLDGSGNIVLGPFALCKDSKLLDATISPSGQWVASICDGRLEVWPLSDGGEGIRIEPPPEGFAVSEIAFLEQKQTLIVASESGQLASTIYPPPPGGSPWKDLATVGEGKLRIALDPDGQLLGAGGSDGRFSVWHLDASGGIEEPVFETTLEGLDQTPLSLECLAVDDSERVAVVGPGGLWVYRSKLDFAVWPWSSDSECRHIAFYADDYLLLRRENRSLELWKIGRGRPYVLMPPTLPRVQAALAAEVGRYAKIDGLSQVFGTWDLETPDAAEDRYPQESKVVDFWFIASESNVSGESKRPWEVAVLEEGDKRQLFRWTSSHQAGADKLGEFDEREVMLLDHQHLALGEAYDTGFEIHQKSASEAHFGADAEVLNHRDVPSSLGQVSFDAHSQKFAWVDPQTSDGSGQVMVQSWQPSRDGDDGDAGSEYFSGAITPIALSDPLLAWVNRYGELELRDLDGSAAAEYPGGSCLSQPGRTISNRLATQASELAFCRTPTLDTRYIAAGFDVGLIKLWELTPDGACRLVDSFSTGTEPRFAFNKTCEIMISGDSDGSILFWSFNERFKSLGKLSQGLGNLPQGLEVSISPNNIQKVALSPDDDAIGVLDDGGLVIQPFDLESLLDKARQRLGSGMEEETHGIDR